MSSGISDPFGGVVISVFFSILLLGAMIVQLYIYFDRYPKDNVWLKVFIVVLFTLDILNSVFTIMWVYKLLIDNFGNFVALDKSDWTIMTDPLLTGVMTGMVQVFFAWKIWVLTKNYFYVGAILICALTSSAGGMATSIAGIPIVDSADWNELRIKLFKFSLVWLAPATLGDLIITFVITICLQRAKGSIRRTNRVLNRIIRRLLTAIVALIDLILCPAVEASVQLECVAFILPKLYTNSVLSSLNARQAHTHDIEDEVNSLAIPWNSGEVLISVEYDSHEMRDPHNQKNASITLSDD
ncbi:hypothetical protein ARMGADRAFT_1010721 [Armillaria gallica]|uniref:DUF6534 domain-containing protein n=1 Tax=Armillaria gallica TaxID=47427 RepID=A0A2H3DY72_ARMGA|nr:hypothetical protein ARMGADRAFT_1010721 [Armillaria gallica]